MNDISAEEAPRTIWHRAREWLLPGFIVGFFLGGQPYIANAVQHGIQGLIYAGVAYAVAAGCIRASNRPDKKDGSFGAFVLRLIITIAVTAMVGVLLAIIIPASRG